MTGDVLHGLESGRIRPGLREIDVAALPKPLACEAYSKNFGDAGDYWVPIYYTGSEWVTAYCGGDEYQVFAAVRGGRGMVNGERWYFCDFEMLRAYIETNMRRPNNGQP